MGVSGLQQVVWGKVGKVAGNLWEATKTRAVPKI